jgi:multicomponent Na+:H+ antiporter subunit C
MTGPAIFGLLGSALIGLGLAGLVLHREPLRRVLAFSILGGGTFLIFGVVARRGAAGGVDADPVPQAMVITGIVVAFAALALAVTLMQRLEEQREAEENAASAAAARPDDAG